MKKCLFTALTLFVVFLIHGVANAQSEADRLEDKLSHYIETKMPGWKHKRGEPMLGTSKDVVTEFWGWSNRVVKISVMPHKTPDEAREAIREFVKYDREKQELNGFSDEAYAWGFGLGNVVFRRGKFNVYVSTVADVDDDADARTLSQSERDARMKSEMKRLSQEFARLVSVALIDVP